MRNLRPIPGHDGYFCGIDGSIWSTRSSRQPRKLKTFWRGNRSYRARAVNLSASNKWGFRTHSVHGLVALTWIGPRPDGRVVMHLDDDTDNNAASNLRYGTPATNSAQMVRNGRSAAGERHPGAKLTWDQVQDIRRRLASGETGRSVARDLGISETHVSEIRLNRVRVAA